MCGHMLFGMEGDQGQKSLNEHVEFDHTEFDHVRIQSSQWNRCNTCYTLHMRCSCTLGYTTECKKDEQSISLHKSEAKISQKCHCHLLDLEPESVVAVDLELEPQFSSNSTARTQS